MDREGRETVFTCLYPNTVQTRLSRDQRPTKPVSRLGTGIWIDDTDRDIQPIWIDATDREIQTIRIDDTDCEIQTIWIDDTDSEIQKLFVYLACLTVFVDVILL